MASRAALLRRDGQVVGVDGVNGVEFRGHVPDLYYVAVRHRNHLGIATANAVLLGFTATTMDFTTGSIALMGGLGSTVLVGGTRCLRAGDANGDGRVSYTGPDNDRDAVLFRIGGANTAGTFAGYATEDINMDGVTRYTNSGNDRDRIISALGGMPNDVRSQALP